MLEYDPAIVRRLTQQSDRGHLAELPDGGRVLIRAVRAAWTSELTPCQKRYMLLYYRDLHTMQEIADFYGVNVGTVSRTLTRARNRLRRVIRYYLAR